MKNVFAALAILTALVGCQSPMRTILSLEDGKPTPADTVNVSEKGTYYLYSSLDPKERIYQIDLKKGDPVGFSTHGDRAHATAKGIRIELSDFAEGADYYWKIEEKKDTAK